MSTKAEIIERVRRHLQDGTISDGTILEFVNEGYSRIAGGVLLPDGTLTPPLPELATSATATTSTSASSIAMPATYHRKLFHCYSASQDNDIPIYDALQRLFRRTDNLADSGDIFGVVVKGNTLYYADRPGTADILTLWYFKKVTALSGDSDVPSALPDFLQMPLLSSYALKKVFDLTRRKDKVNFFESEFMESAFALSKHIGPDKEVLPESILETFSREGEGL